MFSSKVIMAFTLAALSSLIICSAYAQWLPGSTEINLGDFKLTSSLAQPGTGVYSIGGGPINAVSTNNLPTNNSSINDTSMTRKQLAMLDLTSYAKDRLKGNLSGYTNIMYPLGESRGSTASTGAGGGGCGCG